MTRDHYNISKQFVSPRATAAKEHTYQGMPFAQLRVNSCDHGLYDQPDFHFLVFAVLSPEGTLLIFHAVQSYL